MPIEHAKPIQDRLGSQAAELAKDWDKVFSARWVRKISRRSPSARAGFLAEVPAQTSATNAQLTNIMMAQDFQDLTGQVIQKVTEMAQEVEQQLLNLLVENCPPERREAAQNLDF